MKHFFALKFVNGSVPSTFTVQFNDEKEITLNIMFSSLAFLCSVHLNNKSSLFHKKGTLETWHAIVEFVCRACRRRIDVHVCAVRTSKTFTCELWSYAGEVESAFWLNGKSLEVQASHRTQKIKFLVSYLTKVATFYGSLTRNWLNFRNCKINISSRGV